MTTPKTARQEARERLLPHVFDMEAMIGPPEGQAVELGEAEAALADTIADRDRHKAAREAAEAAEIRMAFTLDRIAMLCEGPRAIGPHLEMVRRLKERAEKAEADAAQLRARIERLEGALKAATANLVGAASAYRKHASRHRSQGRAVTDPFFSTRARDFEKAAESAQSSAVILAGDAP